MNSPSPDPLEPLSGAVYCPLPAEGVLTVRGRDARDFLNRQCSSDLAALEAGAARLTSYSDARGRVLAAPRVLVESSDALLLLMPADHVGTVGSLLARYVLRSDVRLDEATSDYQCIGVAGAATEKPLREWLGGLPTDAWQTVPLAGTGTLVRLPGPRPRWLACGSPAAISGLREVLDGRVASAEPATWRLLEIEAGLPIIGSETAGHFVAQMINLDLLGAVDFRKGCYPGQEVVARMRYLGRVKRRMFILHGSGDRIPQPGAAVLAGDDQAGEIVAAAPQPAGGYLALAVLRLELASAVSADADGGAVTVHQPPYGLTDHDEYRSEPR